MGRLRAKLTKLLATEGFEVTSLSTPQGIYRQDASGGSCRWAGLAKREGRTVWVYSFDTMTDCCRHGIKVKQDDYHRQSNDWAVYAQWPETETETSTPRVRTS